MEAAIAVSALMLGLAGAPHCAAMCAAPCAAALGGNVQPGSLLAFHGGRIAGYAAAGAVAAGGVSGLGMGASELPLLRPLWALVHAALFVLGLWLLWQGRQPELLARFGRVVPQRVRVRGWQPVHLSRPAQDPRRQGASIASPGAGFERVASLRAGLVGGLWFAWPCGLLQSALLVAALANGATGGAAAMASFAVASSAGLVLGPALWRRLGQIGDGRCERWALRAAGLLMAGLSGWALTQGLWHRVAAYCATL